MTRCFIELTERDYVGGYGRKRWVDAAFIVSVAEGTSGRAIVCTFDGEHYEVEEKVADVLEAMKGNTGTATAWGT